MHMHRFKDQPYVFKVSALCKHGAELYKPSYVVIWKWITSKKIYQGNFTLHVTLFVYFREYRFLCNKWRTQEMPILENVLWSQCVKGKIQVLMRYHLRGLRSVLYDQYCAISNVSGHILPAKMPLSLLVCSSLFCYGCVHTIQVATIRITQLMIST